MQDKPFSAVDQPSTASSKKSPEPTNVGSFGPSKSASTATGASSGPASASSTGLIDQAKETISNVASQAGDKVASRLDTQKGKAAEGLGSIAKALRQTSDHLREQNQGAAVHEYISSAADRVDDLAGYVRSTNVSQMVNGIEQFARRQPALFLGGAFVLGLLGARFLKSSGHASSDHSESIPHSGSLVPRGGGTPTYRQGYRGTLQTGSLGSSSPSGGTPIRRGEGF